MKINNKTRIETDDIRAMAKIVLDRIPKKLKVDLELREAGGGRLTTLYSKATRGWLLRMAIPEKLYDNIDRLKSILGAHLHFYMYSAAWGEPPPTDWDFGRYCQLRLVPIRRVVPPVEVRETKARKRVVTLEAQLAACQKKQVSLEKSLAKAKTKVSYYERRQSKAAQEADFFKRVKAKAAVLPEMIPLTDGCGGGACDDGTSIVVNFNGGDVCKA